MIALVFFLVAVGAGVIAISAFASGDTNEGSYIVMGVAVAALMFVYAFGVFGDSINHRWHDWNECTQGDDPHVRVEACDEYYKAPIGDRE